MWTIENFSLKKKEKIYLFLFVYIWHGELKKFSSSTNFNQDKYIYIRIQFPCAVLRTLINSIPRQPTPPAGNTHPRSVRSIILPPVNSNSISSSIPKRGRTAERRNPRICPHVAIASHFVRIPSGNPAKNRAPLCPSTGEKTLCHLRFRRRGCARRPGLDTLCLFGLEKAVPPSQVCDWNRYSIQKTLGSLEFPREQWRPPRPCPRNGATYFAPY